MNKDAAYIIAGGFVRSVAVSLISVIFGLYVSFLGLTPFQLGILIASGLLGMASATFVTLQWGDRFGRKKLLVFWALLGTAGGVGAAYSMEFTTLVLSAFVGMINGMGRDRGAASALDQAIISTVVSDQSRTKYFAIHSFSQDAGHALGSAMAALPLLFQNWFSMDEGNGYQSTIIFYAILLFASGLFAVGLSRKAESVGRFEKIKLTPETKSRVWKISALFGVDALGSGFITGALIAYYFHERYGISAAEVGGIIAAARIANALSHFGAAWLAGKIGLVRTMVFTHLPAHFLLVAMAFVSEFWIATALFLLHEVLVEMDVPTRNSYVMAIVKPEERTRVAGITQMVRVAGWGFAPVAAGALMSKVFLAMPLIAGATIKAIYDMGLYVAFRKTPAPEEIKSTDE